MRRYEEALAQVLPPDERVLATIEVDPEGQGFRGVLLRALSRELLVLTERGLRRIRIRGGRVRALGYPLVPEVFLVTATGGDPLWTFMDRAGGRLCVHPRVAEPGPLVGRFFAAGFPVRVGGDGCRPGLLECLQEGLWMALVA